MKRSAVADHRGLSMGITGKIAIGYLILVVLFAGVLAYEYVIILELQESTTRLYETYYRAGLESAGLVSDLYALDSLAQKYFLTRGDPDYGRSLTETLERVSTRLKVVGAIPLPRSEAEAFGHLHRSWEDFLRALDVAMSALRDKRPAEAAQDAVIEQSERLLVEAQRIGPLTNRALEVQIESTNAVITQVGSLVLMGGAMALGAGLLVGTLIVRSITRSLLQLTRATRKISKGDLQVQVAETGGDEVAELARHFNLMIRRLEEADELKSDFLSQVSHELKAPMASIQETTSLLLEGIPGPLNESQERLLQLNRDSGVRLSRMINELLQISRLESGMESTFYDEVDFVRLVETVVQEIQPIWQARDVRIDLVPADESMIIECDYEKMIQVVRNLVDNGIKFSPPGSAIRIRLDWESSIPETVPPPFRKKIACPAGRFLRLSVADRGPGVRDSEKERVFDKFHQSERRPNRAGTGVGLGLAIARRLVEAHAGAIWVEDGDAGGSRFLVLMCATRAQGFALPFGSVAGSPV